MIHRFQSGVPEPPYKPNWWLRLTVAVATGGGIALPAWCWFSADFIPVFWISAWFILSMCLNGDIERKYTPVGTAGKWLEQQCNVWRITRQGILLYHDIRQGPCLLLPWQTLPEARIQEGCIQVRDDETDTLYKLPAEEDALATLLSHIQSRIEQHRASRKPAASFEKGIWFMGDTLNLPTLPFVLTALPWFFFGLLYPFIYPDSWLTCILFFVFGASCATSGRYEPEEDFCCENYLGGEVRRSRRGIIIRTEEGSSTYFIPWTAFDEGTATSRDSVFLRLKGEQRGFVLAYSSGYMPIPITRRFTRFHRRILNLGRFALILAAMAAGMLWCALWN